MSLLIFPFILLLIVLHVWLNVPIILSTSISPTQDKSCLRNLNGILLYLKPLKNRSTYHNIPSTLPPPKLLSGSDPVSHDNVWMHNPIFIRLGNVCTFFYPTNPYCFLVCSPQKRGQKAKMWGARILKNSEKCMYGVFTIFNQYLNIVVSFRHIKILGRHDSKCGSKI